MNGLQIFSYVCRTISIATRTGTIKYENIIFKPSVQLPHWRDEMMCLVLNWNEDSYLPPGSYLGYQDLLWVISQVITIELKLNICSPVTRRSIITRYAGSDLLTATKPLELSLVFNEANASFNLFDKAGVTMLLRKIEQLSLKYFLHFEFKFSLIECWGCDVLGYFSPVRSCHQDHVVIATSSARNSFYRARLRQQLGEKYFLVFLLGSAGHTDTNLREESVLYGDILQLDVREEYRALPYKVLAGLVWSKRYQGSVDRVGTKLMVKT